MQTWWAWTFPLSMPLHRPLNLVSSQVISADPDAAGVVGCFSVYAETFPSKGFGVLNIIITLFMVCM